MCNININSLIWSFHNCDLILGTEVEKGSVEAGVEVEVGR